MTILNNNNLLMLLAMLPILNTQVSAKSFKFQLQPPTMMNCNPLNTALVLICGGTRIEENGIIDIQWFHNDTAGNTEQLNHTSVLNENYIKIAAYDGLTMISNITEIAGKYWCDATTTSAVGYTSNVLLVDQAMDYSIFEPCEGLLIGSTTLGQTEATETVSTTGDTRLIQALIAVSTIETFTILVLILSNIIFVVLWRKKRNKEKVLSMKTQEGVQVRSKEKPIPPEKKLSQSDKYKSILMSVTELQKKKPPDPDYVLPDSFHVPSSNAQSSATLTKEVGGHLYAIANPRTRDESKNYQQPNI